MLNKEEFYKTKTETYQPNMYFITYTIYHTISERCKRNKKNVLEIRIPSEL